MKSIILTKGVLVTGDGALDYLENVRCHKAVLVTGGQSMERTGVLGRVRGILEKNNIQVCIYKGISKNPDNVQIMEGTEYLRREMPDAVIAVGGGSAIDAAKAMVLFYDHPELDFDNVFTTDLSDKPLKTLLAAVPSTSGTASEVTQVTVVTLSDLHIKQAIRSEHLRPEIAILDPDLPMSLPENIAAETGMDALTHAIEAYINKNGNDFTDVLAKGAIEGLLRWLPVSCQTGTRESREHVHNYSSMAGMAFSNSGLGMVHGVSHAFGGMYNLAHGLANAVILPYAMDYNKKDGKVKEKFDILSASVGKDIIQAVKDLKDTLGIASRIMDTGVSEEEFLRDYEELVDHSLTGSTAVNPIPVSREDMEYFVQCVFYGKPVNF
ncbi:MAG TPA: iron-containing alcohol dehydrogenase [Candidatus Scybalocola faecavium]|nr:iron-containing alcohol dehydrogenase [Candidatus Scybalocola faecavium]